MRKILCSIGLLLASCAVHASHFDRSFAIVVDERSSREAYTELQAYAHAIETHHQLKVEMIVDQWEVPDSIRNTLYKLYQQKTVPLCGAVFVGDIPIPMIRDAQHLTSAFKMDQTIDRKESSVPSDRYYDDFDLQFLSLGRDMDAPYFYYSLRSDCTQQLQPEIFTGRIRPTDTAGSNRYDKLRHYLVKATQAKEETNPLDQVFYFTGNGSLNESKVAAIDEKATYYEHFPWLNTPQQSISYMDYSQQPSIKPLLMNEMMRLELDFAVLHHHGSSDTQYLNSTTLPKTVQEAKQLISYRLRTSIRQKRNVSNRDSLVAAMAQKYDIPVKWLTDAFHTETIREDSIKEAALNLHLDDFADYGYAPSCRLVILDACFNASFHLDNSIANAYIFSPGKTIAVVGGTVNLLQDKWYDRFAGLLGMGMYAGYFNLFQGYLESHLIGDPTFCFSPQYPSGRLNDDIATHLRGEDVKRLDKKYYTSHPDLEALYMEMMYRKGKLGTAPLLAALQTSVYSQVRMQALHLLSEARGEAFVKGIGIAASDRTEMVQRFAVNYIRSNGDHRLAAPLMALLLQNNTSQRVAFNTEQALMYFPKEVLMKEFNRQFPQHNYVKADEVKNRILKLIDYSAERWADEVDDLFKPSLTDNQFNFIASCMRLYCPHSKVPDVLRYITTCNQPSRQTRMIEALGWMSKSYQAPLIAQTMLNISKDTKFEPSVRNEALKTYHRVK